MSAWRKKAIDCAPELREEFEKSDTNLYKVFAELMPILKAAHMSRDLERLEKIYDFAEWCFRQKDKNLWNAAGVSFYEHLGDTDETFSVFTTWIKKELYADIRGLLYQRLDDLKLKKLDEYYKWKEAEVKREIR